MAHKGSMRSAPVVRSRRQPRRSTECNYGKAVWGNDFSSGVGLPQLARFAELNEVVEIQGAN